jgi:hypothetical protein
MKTSAATIANINVQIAMAFININSISRELTQCLGLLVCDFLADWSYMPPPNLQIYLTPDQLDFIFVESHPSLPTLPLSSQGITT